MKYLLLLLCLIIIPILLFSPLTVESVGLNDATGGLKTAGEKAYGTGSETNPAKLAGKYIRIFLTLLGVIFMILLVYGGYVWMTSYGDKTKVEKAKDLITNAVIGLIILLAAYAISTFIVTRLIAQTTT